MDIPALYHHYKKSKQVSTDTRKISSGAIFFALKGPNFNANALAAEALTKGASLAVIDDAAFAVDERYLIVPDTLLALQELATYHRTQLKIPVIGLTGSNGKTTSKELLTAVLRKKFRVQATAGNLNNHIGVPLTVLAIEPTTEIAVVEMGANHVGEIKRLCEIANPSHGFITNIGTAHIGMFGGFENIVRAKSELYDHLLMSGGTVFVNSANAVLAPMAKRFQQPFFYPGNGDYYHCEFIKANPFVTVRAENGHSVSTQLIGAYNFENIAAALCLGKFFNVDPVLANEALAEYTPGNMRSQLIHQGTNTIILDAYNANPDSMEAAIVNLANLDGSRKVAIVGDMYELGDESERAHSKIGELLKLHKIDEAYLCGALIKSALDSFPAAKYFLTRDSLADHLREHPVVGATILIKASRGMALEKILDVI